MQSLRVLRGSLVASATFFVGCTAILGDFSTGDGDGGTGDASLDAAIEASVDARSTADVAVDTGPVSDTGTDAHVGVDASIDASADSPSETSTGCPTNEHLCSAACVANSDVANCGTSSCSACAIPAHATSTCDGTNCSYTCAAGYADCNGMASDGCEVNTNADPGNCGACAHSCLVGSCNGSGTCIAGQVTSITAAAGDLAIDATNVYFTGPGAIYQAPKTGAAVTFLDSSPEPGAVNGIAIDSGYVYWTDAGTSSSGGSIRKTPKGGNAVAQVLYQYAAGTPEKPFGVAVGGTKIYWSATGGAIVSPSSTHLGGSVDNDGTSGAEYTYSGVFNSGVERVAADSAGAFIASESAIYSFSQAAFSGGGYALALDANYVYWSGKTTGVGSVGRTKRDNSSSGALVNNLTNPTGIAVDASNIYWVDNSTGTVNSVPLGGGATTTIVTGQNGPNAIAVDATGIYWTTTDGKVMAIAK